MLISPLSSWNKITSQKTHFSPPQPNFSGYTLHVSKAMGKKPEDSIVYLDLRGEEGHSITMHSLQCAGEKAKLVVMAPDWTMLPKDPRKKLQRVRRAKRAGTQVVLHRKDSFKLLYTGINQALQGAVIHVKALQTDVRRIKLDIKARRTLRIKRADMKTELWA